MKSKLIFGLKIVGFTILCVLGIGLLGWAIMALWNCLMPEIFGLPTVTYWQALGLFALAKLLFGGFFKGKHRHCGGCHKHEHGGGYFRRKWREKLEKKVANMTPEEKEKWKNHFFYRCGGGFEDSEKKTSSDEQQGS